jgi:hypothetical protein
MASNATASGIGNDTAKKRKGPPSANEIFSDPVIVTRGGDTASNGETIVAPVRVFPIQSQKVRHFLFRIRCKLFNWDEIDTSGI